VSEEIGKVANRIIQRIGNTLDTSETKAILSKLRNSIGQDFTSTVEIWPIIFEELPMEYLSRQGEPTYQEIAILSTLQLYALHQQGNVNSVHKLSIGVGSALKKIRNSDEKSLDRRFNTMITSSSISELLTHLRHLISILKQKQKGDAKLDYAKLASDLYWYQISLENANQMRLRWGQDYYSKIKNKEEVESNDK